MYYLLSLAQEDQFIAYTSILMGELPPTWVTGVVHEFYDDDLPYSDLNLLAKFINYTGGMSHEAYDNAH